MFKMSLNRVHDTVQIREGNEKLTLKVDADPMRLTAGLVQAGQVMKKWGDAEKVTVKQQREYALFFAGVMFGQEQAQKLLEFYHNNPGCVVNVCGQYFEKRLRKLVEKAQKRLKDEADR